jgi:hypothetical protein
LIFRSKAAEGASSTSSSSDDLDSLLGTNRAFSGVVIDPVPSGIRKSGAFDDIEVEARYLCPFSKHFFVASRSGIDCFKAWSFSGNSFDESQSFVKSQCDQMFL